MFQYYPLPSLILAVMNSNYTQVKNLLEQGAAPNITDAHGRTALFYAKSIQIAEILLSFGADINLPNNNGNTVLIERASDFFGKFNEFNNFLLTYPTINKDVIYPSSMSFYKKNVILNLK
jgi:ankyrin repeat protein